MPPTQRKKMTATSKTMLLSVIANLAPLHGGAPPRELVARRAGYGNAKTPAFKMALKRAEKRGHVDLSEKTTVALTDLGYEQVGSSPDQTLPSNEETHAKIKSELSPKMNIVFDFLQDGQMYSRHSIALSLGYTSEKEAGFKMLMNRIRDKGYLEFVDKISVQLSDVCFPMGRTVPK